ncbi:hypothetical protein E2C01_031708 [Portunus trituberculatus]|uniref:Uncharacterized protein n=1 Tax=Portunus trituberculatus TaxID=210409 RepID=A0A5B7F0T5_PORTR|nr:hypothetical protein [Portunus trituberculatus]
MFQPGHEELLSLCSFLSIELFSPVHVALPIYIYSYKKTDTELQTPRQLSIPYCRMREKSERKEDVLNLPSKSSAMCEAEEPVRMRPHSVRDSPPRRHIRPIARRCK